MVWKLLSLVIGVMNELYVILNSNTNNNFRCSLSHIHVFMTRVRLFQIEISFPKIVLNFTRIMLTVPKYEHSKIKTYKFKVKK